MLFTDRKDAGRRLAAELSHLRAMNPVVLGLPRGGVPVAFEVAKALDAPLDVIVVRKLGVPYQPELGMGAIGEGGVQILNEDVVRSSRVTQADIDAVMEREEIELARRADRFRGDRPRVPLTGRTVIVVDDGIATGSTARAACQVARSAGASRVILAAPVAPPRWSPRPGEDADELVCVARPRRFMAIGQFYDDFTQTADREVIDCLTAAESHLGSGSPAPWDVTIPVDSGVLEGILVLPPSVNGTVVFAHGSGSSRLSPRNRFVAETLNRAGLATLLFDLLTPDEERDRRNVFDVELLGRRLALATDWLRSAHPDIGSQSVGLFGASTGAAAALWAAADDASVGAVVSRGGRPDLAGNRLAQVSAPTRLIVGGADSTVLDLNRRAQAQLRCETDLVVVPGATHLFEEPGALEEVAASARDWFVRHLTET